MNTLDYAEFRILIYKRNNHFVGVCYETGFVEESKSMQEVKEHIHNGIIALLKTIQNKELSEKAITQKPLFKYRILFFVVPFLFFFRSLKITFFTEPFYPCRLGNTSL